jgi:FKBP-type peptidyl-prolyl cis-trans isomerase
VRKVFAVFVGALMLSSFSPVIADDGVGNNDAGLRYWNEIKRETVTTESGLQYKALITGKGRKPGPRSKVKVHYRGLLLNGVTFDTSFNEDEPVSMSLKSVIEGWQEGIQLMPVGSVFVFLIPPELAYGSKGSDPIPPNATLIFEIELFSTK